MAITYLVTTN